MNFYMMDAVFRSQPDPLGAWYVANEARVLAVAQDVAVALNVAQRYESARLRLPKGAEDFRLIRENIEAVEPEKAKRWRKIIPHRYAVRQSLLAAIEGVEGAERWVRKDQIDREDGTQKNVIVGTRIRTRYKARERTGVVIGTASDEVSKKRAKEATGTTQAVRIRFDVEKL